MLATAVGYLPLRVFGGGGIERAHNLEGQLKRVRERIQTLRLENGKMRAEAHGLRDNLHAIERVARDDLGLVRPGDLVFQLE